MSNPSNVTGPFRRAASLLSFLWIVATVVGFASLSCRGDSAEPSAPLRIAAAADLKFCTEEILQRFNREHPNSPASVSFGSSGIFFTQIQNGAPFDLFLSADIAYPRQLAQSGMAASPVFVYGFGRLVIWVPDSVKVDWQHPGLQLLLEPSIQKIALANPDHAPYGRAAISALKSAGLYEKLAPKLVQGENIAQAAQFAQSRAADAGLLALSLALAPALRQTGKFWEVPPDSYPKLEQGGVVLKSGNNQALAEEFRDCLVHGWGREILKKSGFITPEK
jgi:molybdate transport system substrate-binding protein